MAIARIITRNPEEVSALSEELHARGYTVEVVAPGGTPKTAAELELVVDKVARSEAFKEARKRARRADADLYVAPSVLDESAEVERGNGLLAAPRAALERLRAWQAERADRNAAREAERAEQKRLRAEEAERQRQEREAAMAEQRAASQKRREQEALEHERRRAEEAEAKHARELMLAREREARARLAAQEKERRRREQEEHQHAIAAEKERIRGEQAREAEERQAQLAELARRHEELERSRAATTVIAVQQRPELVAPAPVTEITRPAEANTVADEREDALRERFRRIAHEEVAREMAERGAGTPTAEEDGGIRRWKGAFAGAACIAIALAIALGFAVTRAPEPAQASPGGATVGPAGTNVGANGVTLGPQANAPAQPVRPNPPLANRTKPAPVPTAKPKAHRRQSSLRDDTIADDTVTVHHYVPPAPPHITTAKNGVKQISDDQ